MLVIRATSPPPKDDAIVVTVALAASLHLFPVTPKVEPELKASQPHHSMNSPVRA